jgi:Tfp pilus assembly protein PilF
MPGLAEARLNLGLALEHAEHDAEALIQFEKVLEQNPGNALAQAHAQALRRRLKPAP